MLCRRAEFHCLYSATAVVTAPVSPGVTAEPARGLQLKQFAVMPNRTWCSVDEASAGLGQRASFGVTIRGQSACGCLPKSEVAGSGNQSSKIRLNPSIASCSPVSARNSHSPRQTLEQRGSSTSWDSTPAT